MSKAKKQEQVSNEEQELYNTVSALQAAHNISQEVFGPAAKANDTFVVYELFELDDDGAHDPEDAESVKEALTQAKTLAPTIFTSGEEVTPETVINLYICLFGTPDDGE